MVEAVPSNGRALERANAGDCNGPPAGPSTILLLGTSNLRYADTGPGTSVADMLEAGLAGCGEGGTWTCEVRPCFYGPRMAEIADKHCTDVEPRVVYLRLVGNLFLDRAPIAVVRRRWPRFYPAARRVADRLKRISGGHKLNTPRGALYRLPRWLMAAVIGAETEVNPEDALRWTRETLAKLARREDAHVVCGFSVHVGDESRDDAAYMARLEGFKDALRAACESHHIPLFDREVEMERAGIFDRRAMDEAYAGLSTRRFEAHRLAEVIVRETSHERE